jgi:hypothetical protein
MIKNRQQAQRLRTIFSALWAPTLAQASVTVYGIADVGIGFEKSGGPGGAKVTRLASGYGSGSRLLRRIFQGQPSDAACRRPGHLDRWHLDRRRKQSVAAGPKTHE